MSNAFDWSKFKNDDSKIRFTEPGTQAVGEIVEIKVVSVTSPKGDTNDMAELTLRCADGATRTVLAAQRDLKRQLAEKKPQVGDRIKIEYTGLTQLGGGKAAKNFDVQVKAADANAAAAGASLTVVTDAEPF